MSNSSNSTISKATGDPLPPYLIAIVTLTSTILFSLIIYIVFYLQLRQRRLATVEIIHNRDQKNSSSVHLMDTEVMTHRVSSPRMVHQPLYGAESTSSCKIISTTPKQCRPTHPYVNADLETTVNQFNTQRSVESLEKEKQPSMLHKTRPSTDGMQILDDTPNLQQEHHHNFKTNTRHNCLPKTQKEDSVLMAKLASSTIEKDIDIVLSNCTELNKISLANNNDAFADCLNVARTQSVQKSKAAIKLNPEMEEKKNDDIQTKYSTHFDFKLETKESCDILTHEKKESLYVNYFQTSYLKNQNLQHLSKSSFDNQTFCATDSKSENICKVRKQHNKRAKLTVNTAHQNARSKSDVTSCREYINAQKPSSCLPSKCTSAIRYVNVSLPQTSEMTDAKMSFFERHLTRHNSDYENPDEFKELKVECGSLKRVRSASVVQNASDLVHIKVETGLEDDYLPMSNPRQQHQIKEDIYTRMASTHINSEPGIANRIVDDDRGENFETEYINISNEIDADTQLPQNINNLPSFQNIDQHMPLPPQCIFRNSGYINCVPSNNEN